MKFVFLFVMGAAPLHIYMDLILGIKLSTDYTTYEIMGFALCLVFLGEMYVRAMK